jgi:hypothetical protein
LFKWLSIITLPITAKYVFLRNPDVPEETVSTKILLEETGRETTVAAERPG